MALPAGFPELDFDRYHRTELPALLAEGRAGIAARAASGLRRLALRVGEGSPYTYTPGADTVAVTAGDDDADTVLELDSDSWQGLVYELEAPAGLFYANRVRCIRGDAIDLMAWESTLRALYNGRPPYEPGDVQLHDETGAPLDPSATFTLASSRGAMRHFLRTAGYLFVRGVYREEEIAAFRAEATELEGEARKGDRFSWWGRNAAGEEILCRVTRAATKPHLNTLRSDPRLFELARLADEHFVNRRGEGDGVTVIFKRPEMVAGLGDLPWHRDCGMGGHATMCPLLIASIYLTEAAPESGELMMLPGSHRAAFNAHDPTRTQGLSGARFHARPGDVSLHFGDTVHAAPPPQASDRHSYRISAVVGFAHPDAHHHRGEKSYNDVLHRRDDGQIEHLVTVAKRL